jgi:hypothetical protein
VISAIVELQLEVCLLRRTLLYTEQYFFSLWNHPVFYIEGKITVDHWYSHIFIKDLFLVLACI